MTLAGAGVGAGAGAGVGAGAGAGAGLAQAVMKTTAANTSTIKIFKINKPFLFTYPSLRIIP